VGSIATILQGLQARRGFLGFLIAALLGALGVLGHAPFHIWPAFCVSISGLLLLLDGVATRPKPVRAGFFVAWSWAFGYFLAGMFWVGNAFLVDAQKFALIMPFAVTALPATIGVFWGLAGAAYAATWCRDASRLVVFALVFSIAEFARGHLFTGLPWNLPAYIWWPGEIISQTSALIGPYGLTLVTLFVLASPAALAFGSSDMTAKRVRIFVGLAAFLGAISTLVYGGVRLNQAGAVDPMAGDGPLISAGQGGYTQREVWDPANASRVTQTYLDLLDHPSALKSDIVVWPEGAFPFLLLEQPDVLQAIEAKLGNRTLITGSIRRGQGQSQVQGSDAYWNSILVFDRDGGPMTLRSTYDKFHLVPFGEYLPFRPIFKALGIASLVAYDGEMTPGPGPSLLPVRGAPVADPRVCYEIVFPNFNPGALGKAGWILNVSIDAWYGDLLGPDQHYAQARSRAIETGTPLVRAASGGWSAIVDRYGRPLAEHRSGAGYVFARLPLDAGTTTYGRYGEAIFIAFLGFLFVLLVVWRHKGVDFTNRLEDEGRKK
jgi:apolipoprotein N-acyltransferase